MNSDHLLEVNNLYTTFRTERGKVTAVENVSFHVDRGEMIGLVGESGCGKSVTSESIMQLLNRRTAEISGEVVFEGRNLLSLGQQEMRKIRGCKISMVFQDPMSSLNPVYTIGDQIAEAILTHGGAGKAEALEKAVELVRMTEIPFPEQAVGKYPHELSGGMRQRVLIAMALACRPSLLIADEPTTALDVTIQAQILDLLFHFRESFNMGIILITHALGVVAELCSRVIVMYSGEIVEEGPVGSIFSKPLHPYTRGLPLAMPQIQGDRKGRLKVIKGVVPSLYRRPAGCRFAPRCDYAIDACLDGHPDLASMDGGKKVRCLRHEKLLEEAFINEPTGNAPA